MPSWSSPCWLRVTSPVVCCFVSPTCNLVCPAKRLILSLSNKSGPGPLCGLSSKRKMRGQMASKTGQGTNKTQNWPAKSIAPHKIYRYFGKTTNITACITKIRSVIANLRQPSQHHLTTSLAILPVLTTSSTNIIVQQCHANNQNNTTTVQKAL